MKSYSRGNRRGLGQARSCSPRPPQAPRRWARGLDVLELDGHMRAVVVEAVLAERSHTHVAHKLALCRVLLLVERVK